MRSDSKLFRLTYFLYAKTFLGRLLAMRRLRKARLKYPNGHTDAQLMDYMGVMVKIIPQGYDNYGFVVWNNESDCNECVLIDVYDAELFIRVVREVDKVPVVVLNTHWHWDHCAGNRGLLNEYPNLAIYGGKNENVYCANRVVDHADEINAAGLTFSVELVPGHTSYQVVYRLHVPEMQDCMFTGDFLFVGGIGRLFEGSDARLLSSLLAVKTWQPETLIFPGHEFAKQDLEFALSVEPDNEYLNDMYFRVCDIRLSHYPAMPTALEDEFNYNPFLRLREEGIVEGLEDLGFAAPIPRAFKGRTRLDPDIIDFNFKVEVLRNLRRAKEDFEASSKRRPRRGPVREDE